MKGVRVILLWLQLVWITQINGGNKAPKPKPKPKPKPVIDCGKVKSDCENDIFAARCTGDQMHTKYALKCCSSEDPTYKFYKKHCPDVVKALGTFCKKKTFQWKNKIQVNGKSLPCECTPSLCDAEINKRIGTEKKGKGPSYHVDITDGPCCDIKKSEFYDICPKAMKVFEEHSIYSCKMVSVDGWWQRCDSVVVGCAREVQKGNKKWKSLCCSKKSMLHEQCPTEMASFIAAGSCD